jgi:hypothetical protein
VGGLLALGRRPEDGGRRAAAGDRRVAAEAVSLRDVGPRRANRDKGVNWGSVFIPGAVPGEKAPVRSFAVVPISAYY